VIQPPHRSITRFFIPLIDVLILLFGVFLLMPLVSSPPDAPADPDAGEAGATARPVDELRLQVVDLQLKLEQARQEIDALRKAQANPANRLSVRVLEIDPGTGKLYYFDPDSPDPRQEVRDQADAQRLIDQQKRRAQGKDVFFLLLYPRTPTGFPTQQQVNAYRRWFRDVPFGFDNPWAVPTAVNRP
jgi:hypothetical protein